MAIPFGRRRWRWTRRRFARSDIDSSISSRMFLESLPRGPVTRDESPSAVRDALDLTGPLPESGTDPGPLLERTAQLLFEHSLFNGHPRFFGYITAPPAPIGILGDFLAAAVNPNVGAWTLSPAATEIESQTVRWIAALIGYPVDCGGLLVSGGNMANFVCFLAARAAKAGWDVREHGVAGESGRGFASTPRPKRTPGFRRPPTSAASAPASIRWIPTDARLRMDVAALRRQIEADAAAGDVPCLVVGTAGSVSTGAVDPLPEIGALCREYGVWFHVDGAYGGFAAAVPEAPDDLRGLSLADSVAVDPHKWLYAPLEAGCALVRDPEALRAAFAYHPPYYHFEEHATNYVDYGPQNSRGFRALKVWLALRHVGRRRLPHDDCRRHPPVSGDGRRGRPARGAGARHAGAEHHDVPLRAARSSSERRRAGGRAPPRCAQPRAARSAAARRRGVRLQRRRRRPLRAARLHREFPHRSSRCGGGAGDRGAHGTSGRCRAAAGDLAARMRVNRSPRRDGGVCSAQTIAICRISLMMPSGCTAKFGHPGQSHRSLGQDFFLAISLRKSGFDGNDGHLGLPGGFDLRVARMGCKAHP